MRMRVYNILALALLIAACPQLPAAIDPRQAAITSEQFDKSMSLKVSELHRNIELLTRAYTSGIAQHAYDTCIKLRAANPDSPVCNFNVGLAASNLLRWDGLFPPAHAPTENILDVSEKAFARAYKQSPNNPQIMLDYGFNLWEYDVDRKKGIKLIKQALTLMPNDPRAHATLALAYATPSTPYMDVAGAKRELNIAIKRDRNYAFPHNLLWSLESDSTDQKHELELYDSLRGAHVRGVPH